MAPRSSPRDWREPSVEIELRVREADEAESPGLWLPAPHGELDAIRKNHGLGRNGQSSLPVGNALTMRRIRLLQIHTSGSNL